MNRFYGVRATDGYTDLFVAYNTVSDSTIGVYVDASSTGNTFLHNVIKRSAKLDCLDESSGTLTAGTGNLWRRNHGDTGSSIPADICPI